MGDPRHSKKTYQKPQVPWQEERIQDERILMEKYGLRRKQELYRAQAKLKGYKDTAKRLATEGSDQADKEKNQLFDTLNQYGLLQEDTLTDVLSISLEQLLGRRLQTLLVDQDLAKSPQQARQFITHKHITINEETVHSPSYLVTVQEEPSISFDDNSPYSDDDHPERPQPEPHEVAEQQSTDDTESNDETSDEEKDDDE